MMKKIAIFVLSAVLALTAGLVVACSEVNLKKSETKQHTVTYYYNYSGAPSDVYKTEKVDSGTAAKKPANPTRNGYTFTEWTTDTAGKVTYNFSIPVVLDLKLYAQWRDNSIQPELTGIEATVSKTYKAGDTFGKSDITVTAKYSDNSTAPVTDFTYTEPDMSTAGEKTVTVSYSGKSTTVTFTVSENTPDRTLEDIEVTAPTKTIYTVGEELDLTGMTVKAHYDDMSVEDVDVYDCSVTGYNANQTGSQTITVTYQGKSKTFTVTVNAVPVTVTRIVVTPPTKTTYAKGEALNRAGMVVTAYYSDNTSGTVAAGSYQVSGYNANKVGEQEITVTYEGQTDKFTVTVTAATITEIKITTKPTKLDYEVFDELDLTGMVVTATLSDHTTQPVTNYTVDDSAFNNTQAGTYKITISYQDFEDDFNVTVKNVQYTVKFKTNVEDKPAPADQKINKNGLVTAPNSANYQRAGYTFLGWFKGEETTAYKFNTPVTEGFTLTAKWSIITYTITYIVDDTTIATAPAAGSYTVEDDDITSLPAPTILNETYNFLGWYKTVTTDTEGKKVYSNKVTSIDTASAVNYTLYAYIDEIPTFTVTFDLGYAGKTTTDTVMQGETATRPEQNPTRTGYNFDNWYTSNAFTTTYDFDNTTITDDTTVIYAKWTAKNITVTFDPENDEETYTAPVAFNQVIPAQTVPTKLGHTFAGWYRINGGAQWDFSKTLEEILAPENKEALTLEAHWTANTYAVVIKPENGSANITIADVTFGTLIPTATVPTNPTKLGHTFDGWWTDGDNAQQWNFATDKLETEGLTLIAKWKANNYSVKFYDGATLIETKSVKFGAKVPTPTTAPTKTGYDIEGWYNNAELTGSKWVFGDTATLQTEGLNLYVKWEAKSVSVKFVDSDGTEYTTYATTAKYDGEVTKPANPTKTGYTFLHWHILDSHEIWYFVAEDGHAVSTVQQTSELTLEAHWQANMYTITYHMGEYANALTAEAYLSYTYGTAFTLPAADYVDGNLVNTDGYSFEGWYENADFTGDSYTVIPATATGDKVFYAKITQNAKVLFTFNLGYGEPSGYPTSNVVIGTKVTKPADPTRDYYDFGGWYTKSTCLEGDEYNFNATVTKATTVYAKWTPKKYTVTFDANGGKFVNDDLTEDLTKQSTFTYEETVAKYSKNPTRDGYTFGYWYVNNENTEYTFGNHPTANITLKAKWNINKYTVTLVYNDGSEDGTIENVEHGSTITKPANPTHADGAHDFVRWCKDSALTTPWNFETDTVTSDNVTLYAEWKDKEYKVTFNVDGGVGTVAEQTIKHGGKVKKPADNLPTKAGYHLKAGEEWTLLNGTVWNFTTDTVTRAIVLKANWEINKYTVTFNSNGGSAVDPQEVEHGQTATMPTAPTKDGFTFAGWKLGTGTYNFTESVESDITLIATWNGETGTFLYYSTTPADETSWNYGYKAEKNGDENGLVIHRVTVYSGMEFLVSTKKDVGDSFWLKAGFDGSVTLKNVITVENNNGNFKLTITDPNYEGSIWTIYLYNLSGENGSSVIVSATGELNKDCWASISMEQQYDTSMRTPSNETLTSSALTTPVDNTIYIRGSFTDGYKLYKEWSNAADSGLLVLNSGNTYTFRHVYLKKNDGFKIYLSSMGDNGWFGGKFTGLGSANAITLGNDNAPDIYLGGTFENGYYDIVFTNGTVKTLSIVAYAEPTVVTVNVTAPTKTTYWQGQPLDKTGMAVSYTDSDGKTYTLSDGEYTITANPTASIGANKEITVTYDGVVGTFQITVNALTVTFDSKGGSAVAAQNVTYNGVAARPADPTKTGYDFGNWYTDETCTTLYVFGASGTKVTAPITLYAGWTVHEYEVKFSADGSVIKTVNVPYNTAIPTAQIPDAAKEGYTYVWTRGGTAFDFGTLVTEDLQIIATYTQITYVVTFDYDGYRTNETATVNHGAKVAQPVANKTNRTGYTFDGWFYKGESNQDVEFDFDTLVKKAYTLTAKWTVIEYNITYNLAGTVEIGGETVNVSASLAADAKTKYTVEDAFTLAIPTVATSGASFLEWRITVDGEPTTIEAIEKGTTGNITLQAVYTANALVSFTFNYNYTGAPANVVRQVTSGTTTTALAATRTGWTFDGWFEDGSETAYDFTAPIEAATTVYAHWTIHTWKVTFDANDGTLAEGTVSPLPVDYGATVTLPQVERTGYTFLYWSYNGSEWKSTDTMPDNDITLYAEWDIKKYSVTFMDGTTELTALNKTNVPYGSTIAEPTTGLPTKQGYTLNGWKNGETAWTFGEGGSQVTGNITLTADWQIVTYTISYYVDSTTQESNEADNPTTYQITSGTITLDKPAKTGHTFNGWYENSDCTGTPITELKFDLFAGSNEENPVKLYGKFTINKYTVTFNAGEGYWMVDGEQKNVITKEVEYNTAVTAPEAPTRDGYRLKENAGWLRNGTVYSFLTLITSDIELTASWELAEKVDGIYSGDTLIKAFVWSDGKENVEYAAKYFRVENATAQSPLRLKIWIDKEIATLHTNLKNDASYTYVSGTSTDDDHEIQIKQPGYYSLYYQDNGDDNGIWVAREAELNDYVAPEVDADNDGVYVGDTRIAPFVVNADGFNQVVAKNVQVDAADDESTVVITFKYNNQPVTLSYLDIKEGIKNVGTGVNVELYSGTYSFYYNYAKAGTDETGKHDKAAYRMWIEGTQTGGPAVEIPEGAYPVKFTFGSSAPIYIALVKSNGTAVKKSELKNYVIYTYSGETFGGWDSGNTTTGMLKAEMTSTTSTVPNGWIFRWGSGFGTQTANIEGTIKAGNSYLIQLPTSNKGTAEITPVPSIPVPEDPIGSDLQPSEDSIVIQCDDGSIKFTVLKTEGYVYGFDGVNDYSKLFLHVYNSSTNTKATGEWKQGVLNKTFTTTMKMSEINRVIIAYNQSSSNVIQKGEFTIDTSKLYDGAEIVLDGRGIQSYA